MRFRRVLILILMEHAQREFVGVGDYLVTAVLILILMEHAQRDNAKRVQARFAAS